jgi:preprotein translocase subunit SecA
VALDDEIMRKMGGEKIQAVASMLLKKDELETLELNQSQFSSSIVRAQKQMEAMHFSIRKHLFDYDSVINKQRQRIYDKRDNILASEESSEGQETFVKDTMIELQQYITDIIVKQIHDAQAIGQGTDDLLDVIMKELNVPLSSKNVASFATLGWKELEEKLPASVNSYFSKQFKGLEATKLYMMFKEIYLYHLDKLRVEHIDEMQYLREKVALMGYAQQDPLTMYKQQAYEKFQTLLYRFKFDTIASITRVDFAQLNQQPTITIQAGGQSQQEYLEALKKVAGSQELQQMVKEIQVEEAKPKTYQDEDGFEVFEIDDKGSEIKAKG